MAHWRHMMDSDYLFAADLRGQPVTVVIESVSIANLIGEGGRKSRKPAVQFAAQDGKPKPKPLALNATNCRTISNLFGSHDTKDWIGKAITIYPTTTKVGGETVECIRVKPELPTQTARPAQTSAPAKGA